MAGEMRMISGSNPCSSNSLHSLAAISGSAVTLREAFAILISFFCWLSADGSGDCDQRQDGG